VPADGPLACEVGQHLHRLVDHLALRRFLHVACFSSASRGRRSRGRVSPPGEPGESSAALPQVLTVAGHAEAFQRIGDPPPRRSLVPYSKCDPCSGRERDDFVGDLVDLLVVRVARGQRHLGAFLEIDDERHATRALPGQFGSGGVRP